MYVLESILDPLPFPTLLVDTQARVRFMNPLAARLVRQGRSGSVGPSLFELFPDAGDAEGHRRQFESGVARGRLTLSYTSRPVDPLVEGMTELRLRIGYSGAAGNNLALVLVEPLADDRSLSHRLASTEDRLQQVDQIRHELNNLLMGLMGHAELLHSGAAPLDDARNKAELILVEARRMRDSIRSLGRPGGRD